MDTRCVMTPEELAREGVAVPESIAPSATSQELVHARLTFTARRDVVERACSMLKANGATDAVRRIWRVGEEPRWL
jgi:hypothetical protein